MANEKQSLVDELKSLLEQNVTEVKDQVESLKTQFYRQYHEEQAALKKAALRHPKIRSERPRPGEISKYTCLPAAN